jgi:hypothetical protein
LLTMQLFFTPLQTKIGVAIWHGGIKLALCRGVFISNIHTCANHFF